MPEIANALRHETIEANEDDVSGRRAHGRAPQDRARQRVDCCSLEASAAAFENGRAAVPPPVPEKPPRRHADLFRPQTMTATAVVAQSIDQFRERFSRITQEVAAASSATTTS